VLLHRLTETEWLQLHLREICTGIRIRIKLKLQEEERKGDGFTPHLKTNLSNFLLTLLLFFATRKMSYPVSGSKENTKEEQQSIKDDLIFPHVVLLLWEGEGLSNSYIGEGIGRVERRHRGCTSRNLDKALVEFFSRKTNASNDQN
jgi:hypothetical protein